MRTASLLTDGGGGVGMGGSIMVPPFTELLAKDSTSPPPLAVDKHLWPSDFKEFFQIRVRSAFAEVWMSP